MSGNARPYTLEELGSLRSSPDGIFDKVGDIVVCSETARWLATLDAERATHAEAEQRLSRIVAERTKERDAERAKRDAETAARLKYMDRAERAEAEVERLRGLLQWLADERGNDGGCDTIVLTNDESDRLDAALARKDDHA